jgi:hypothetical protein
MAILSSSQVQAAINLNENRDSVTSEFTLGPEISHIEYKEPGVAREKGVMYGVFGEYEARFPGKFVLGADGRFSGGQVDYDGSGSIDGINDFIFEIRGHVGYDFMVLDSTRLTPYVGLGYRFLFDELGGMVSSTNKVGYDRESNYFYLPIGVKTITPIKNGWFLGLNGEFDVFLDGTQKSQLGDAVAGVDTLENDQDKGYGVRGSVRLVKSGEKYDFFIAPFIRYWHIDQSDTATVTVGGNPIRVTGFEPENHSTEYGVQLGLHF